MQASLESTYVLLLIYLSNSHTFPSKLPYVIYLQSSFQLQVNQATS